MALARKSNDATQQIVLSGGVICQPFAADGGLHGKGVIGKSVARSK